jgi:peptide/nickel transport system ATP-binding protein
VYPDEYDELPNEVWDSIERFREIVRERSRISLGTSDKIKRQLGMFSRYDDIDEAVIDLFGDLEIPSDVNTHIQDAVALVKDGRPDAARQLLLEEFGSVCDSERPEFHKTTDSGRQSYCHRHESKYEDVESVLSRRVHGK